MLSSSSSLDSIALSVGMVHTRCLMAGDRRSWAPRLDHAVVYELWDVCEHDEGIAGR